MIDNEYLLISALQHYAFCPRQYALAYIEQAWAENRYTAEGRLLHERVDSGEHEQRGSLRYERGVLLKSETYKIQGKMDLLEIETLDGVDRYFPVEYKRGKPKVEDWDKVQVCAQALCIEEMRETSVVEGSIWYWETRRREKVEIDDALRETTIKMIDGARNLLLHGRTPSPTDNHKRCRACSLMDICEPDLFRKDDSVRYRKKIFESVLESDCI